MVLNIRKTLIVINIVLIIIQIFKILFYMEDDATVSTVYAGLGLISIIITMVLLRKIRKSGYHFSMAFVWMWLYVGFVVILVILYFASNTLAVISNAVVSVCYMGLFVSVFRGILSFLKGRIVPSFERLDNILIVTYVILLSFCIVCELLLDISLDNISAFLRDSILLRDGFFLGMAAVFLIQLMKYGKKEPKGDMV